MNFREEPQHLSLGHDPDDGSPLLVVSLPGDSISAKYFYCPDALEWANACRPVPWHVIQRLLSSITMSGFFV